MSVQSCIEVEAELDIVAARQAGRTLAKDMGFGEVDQARIATAISELARNIYLYAQKGVIILSTVHEDGRLGLMIQAQDNGPGITDIHQAMQDGFTTSGGLGAGLPGVKRLMDTFELKTQIDNGTEITVIKWLR